MFLFEFPQNLIGALAFRHVGGAWGAVTFSRFIFADDRCYDSPLIRHEYGHRLQSALLGPLYLPVIGIPSLIWALLFKGYRTRRQKNYFGFYTEAWADRLSNRDLG